MREVGEGWRVGVVHMPPSRRRAGVGGAAEAVRRVLLGLASSKKMPCARKQTEGRESGAGGGKCGGCGGGRVAGLAVHGVPIAAGEGLRHRVAGPVVHHGEEELGGVVLLVPVVVVRGREGWLQSLVSVDGPLLHSP